LYDTLLNRAKLFGLFTLCIIPAAFIHGCHNNGATEPSPDIQDTPQWHLLTSFSRARRGLAAVVNNGYLYVIGGVDENGNYVTDVEFAKIYPDGTIGQWRSTQALLQGRIYTAAISHNNYLYVIGGGSGKLGTENQPTATVEKARIFKDGQLGPWSFGKALETPRRGLKTAKYNNIIYAIGGYNGTFLKSVEAAKLNARGDIVQWETEHETAQIERYIHSATTYKNFMYLLGGHMHNQEAMSYGDVESAKITPNGQIGPWKIEQSNLNTPRFIAMAAAVDNKLYMIGGHNGRNRLDSVEVTSILSSGKIGTWEYGRPLVMARSAAAIAQNGNFIYVLGGMNQRGLLNTVEVLRL